MLHVRYVHLSRPSIFVRHEPIFSSERVLRKDYDRNGSVEKEKLVVNPKGLEAESKLLPVIRQS
jgi:hypothetical protein